MRILILGGTGLTGPFIVRRLTELGHEVTVFHRGTREPQLQAGVRTLHGNVAELPPSLRSECPDVVIHMWALTEGHARHFLETCRGHTARAVVISSGDV